MHPKKGKQVRGFLGTVNFIKNHIPNRAALLQPLTELTKKDRRFEWKEKQQIAFDTTIAKVSESIMLAYPDPNWPFDIYPDANDDQAMGAMLVQDEKVISTFSRKFTEAQLKYNITKKEFLLALEACKYFHPIIYGCEIKIHSDHMNLQFKHTRHINGRVMRQHLELDQTYQAKIFHIKGELNTGADGLSRLPMYDEVPALSLLETFEEIPAPVRAQVFAIDNIDSENSGHFPMNMLHIKAEQDKISRCQAQGLLWISYVRRCQGYHI